MRLESEKERAAHRPIHLLRLVRSLPSGGCRANTAAQFTKRRDSGQPPGSPVASQETLFIGIRLSSFFGRRSLPDPETARIPPEGVVKSVTSATPPSAEKPQVLGLQSNAICRFRPIHPVNEGPASDNPPCIRGGCRRTQPARNRGPDCYNFACVRSRWPATRRRPCGFASGGP